MDVNLQSSITGDIGHKDWLFLAKPDIENRMANYESGQIEFAILSLVKDPLRNLLPSLAQSTKTLKLIVSRLCELDKNFHLDTKNCIIGSEPRYRLTKDLIDSEDISMADQEFLENGDEGLLYDMFERVLTTQTHLRSEIQEEINMECAEDERTARRRHDHSPLIQTWIHLLAQHAAIKPIADML